MSESSRNTDQDYQKVEPVGGDSIDSALSTVRLEKSAGGVCTGDSCEGVLGEVWKD